MRLSRKEVACLLCLLAFAVTPASAATTYSSATDFFAVIGPDYYLESFDSLTTGVLLSGPFSFSSGPYAYTASSSGSFFNEDLGGGDVVLSTYTALYPIIFAFSSGNVTAVGGNFWLTDEDFDTTTGTTILTLSDGTVVTLVDANSGTFAAFTTDAGVTITSLTVSVSSSGDAWVTVNDLIVGTAGDGVPEPATFVLGAGGLLALAAGRRIRHSRRATTA